jgi:hypothetical protein
VFLVTPFRRCRWANGPRDHDLPPVFIRFASHAGAEHVTFQLLAVLDIAAGDTSLSAMREPPAALC